MTGPDIPPNRRPDTPQTAATPADAAAAEQARALIRTATHAALAVVTADGTPGISRIAFATDPRGCPLTLVSRLSAHTAPLLTGAPCALLIAEPGPKGDPLTHPRLSLQARPIPLHRDDPAFASLAAHYTKQRPKARLYIDFTDFLLVRFAPLGAALNGGFGKASLLTADQL